MSGTDLDLPSEFLLMATHDHTGKLQGWHYYGLSGAILMELALQGHLAVEEGRLTAVGSKPRDDLLAPVWHRIGGRPGKKVGWWVQRIAREHRRLRRVVYGRLERAGILRREERRLGPFRRDRFIQAAPDLEDAIRWRLCDAITYPRPDRRAVCLASLVVGTQVEAQVFPPPLRRTARRVVKDWAAKDAMAGAVKDVVDAVMVAILAAVVASSMGSSSG